LFFLPVESPSRCEQDSSLVAQSHLPLPPLMYRFFENASFPSTPPPNPLDLLPFSFLRYRLHFLESHPPFFVFFAEFQSEICLPSPSVFLHWQLFPPTSLIVFFHASKPPQEAYHFPCFGRGFFPFSPGEYYRTGTPPDWCF